MKLQLQFQNQIRARLEMLYRFRAASAAFGNKSETARLDSEIAAAALTLQAVAVSNIGSK